LYGEASWYWSSSSYSGSSSLAWYVYVSGGTVNYNGKMNNLAVRCVRGEVKP